VFRRCECPTEPRDRRGPLEIKLRSCSNTGFVCRQLFTRALLAGTHRAPYAAIIGLLDDVDRVLLSPPPIVRRPSRNVYRLPLIHVVLQNRPTPAELTDLLHHSSDARSRAWMLPPMTLKLAESADLSPAWICDGFCLRRFGRGPILTTVMVVLSDRRRLNCRRRRLAQSYTSRIPAGAAEFKRLSLADLLSINDRVFQWLATPPKWMQPPARHPGTQFCRRRCETERDILLRACRILEHRAPVRAGLVRGCGGGGGAGFSPPNQNVNPVEYRRLLWLLSPPYAGSVGGSYSSPIRLPEADVPTDLESSPPPAVMAKPTSALVARREEPVGKTILTQDNIGEQCCARRGIDSTEQNLEVGRYTRPMPDR